ncbi:hypothetical protein IFO70_36185 [Phormidium tenue FACHB-886]|nr:hypothetical protein [Phormidium tenue FACHB-886]
MATPRLDKNSRPIGSQPGDTNEKPKSTRKNPATGNPRGRKPKEMPKAPTTIIPVQPDPLPPTIIDRQPSPVDAPTVPPSPIVNRQQGDATLQTLTGLNLPDTIQANLPDFQGLMQVVDVGSPSSFDAAGWSRVTDTQRVEDARHYRELKNYAANIRDGVGVLNEMTLAAVAATDFGKNLIRYATGLEGAKTEVVKFQIQQTETAIAGEKLLGKQNDLQHQVELNAVDRTRDSQLIQFRTQQNQAQALQYQADLEGLAAKLEATQRKNEADLLDTAHKYPALR